VAALVYQRRKHSINLFIWPVGTTTLATRRAEHNGYNAETWSEAGLNFLAVSEIPAGELAEFAHSFQANLQ